MKKFYFILTAAALMVGCAKDNPVVSTVNEPATPTGTVVTLTAEIPQMTKASVDATAFAWEDGDQIAVPSNATGGYTVFTTSTGSLGTFTATLEDGVNLVNGTAFYPASVVLGTYTTAFSSVADAKKGFKMEASYTAGSSSITFSHTSALVHLNFTNVPSFATSVVVNDGSSNVATVALTSPSTSLDVYVPITPNGSKKYSFSIFAGAAELKKVSKTVALAAGTYYSTPVINTPIYLFVSKFNDWSYLYAYVYYDGGKISSWPGTQLTGTFYTINEKQYYMISADATKSKTTHVILNAGDANLAKPFTRIETESFTPTCSKLITLSTVDQANLVLYFRDDTGQNDNWGDYKIYGWYDDDTKIFGAWPGTSKGASIFSWNEYSTYGQKSNYIASYTFTTGKPKINLQLNNGTDSKKTNNISLAAGKSNWFVVSNGCTGDANTESFPTVSVSVE